LRYQSNVSDFAQPAELTHLTPAERRLWASVNRPRRVAIARARADGERSRQRKDKGDVVIRNSQYWIAPDITVSRADKSRFRLFGRN
jgi:hypothetical protein